MKKMFYTHEMENALTAAGYRVRFYESGTLCDVLMGDRLMHRFKGEWSLYNWMCDCELL